MLLNFKLLNKKDKLTPIIMQKLLMGALCFYPKEYHNEVKKAALGIQIYLCEKDEPIYAALEKIAKIKLSQEEKENYLKMNTTGMNLVLPNGKHVVIYKDISLDNYKNGYIFTLAHEIFGHGVSRINDFQICLNGEKYKRDGVCLIDQTTGKKQNEAINEGFMDYIAGEILKNSGIEFTLPRGRLYEIPTNYVSMFFQIFNKKELLDILVKNKGTLENLLGSNFKKMSDTLDFMNKTQNFDFLKLTDLYFQEIKERTYLSIDSLLYQKIMSQIPPDIINLYKDKVLSKEITISQAQELLNRIYIIKRTSRDYKNDVILAFNEIFCSNKKMGHY